MNKILFAPLNKKVFLFDRFKANITTAPIYGDLGVIRKILRKLMKKMLPEKLMCFWYRRDFLYLAGKSDICIFFDAPNTIHAANFVKNKYPGVRVIYWFWNHIDNKEILNKLHNDIEKWSYDISDCEEYNLSYNTQFFFPEFQYNDRTEIVRDCLFIGKMKGRTKEIEDIKAKVMHYFPSSDFIVLTTHDSPGQKNWIPYDEIIEQTKRSKCIIDIVANDQKGLTLRPLEAMFLNKKLITNQSDIKRYDFYNPSNIYIIGEDNEERILSFMNSPVVPVPDNIKEKYTFENWLKRF